MDIALLELFIRRIIERNNELFENFYNSIHSTYNNEVQIDKSTDTESLAEIYSLADDTKDLSFKLLIIALYSHLEISIKTIGKTFFTTTDNETKKLFNFKEMKKFFLKKDIDITQMKNYDSYNELRLICNAIKHSDRVTNELSSEYPSWLKGNKFTDLEKVYLKLYSGAKEFTFELINKCANNIKNKFHVQT